MPSVRRLRLPVPVNIITGSLASGKTTFIGALLRQKPPDQVWAVLVNEFGAAGLDAALLEGSSGAGRAAAGTAAVAGADGDGSSASGGAGSQANGSSSGGSGGSGGMEGVHIKQLAGGCLCCALSNVTALAIAQLLRSVKPDRLIIEPSGLAHPAALVDMLQGEHLGSSLALQPVVCLVDATQFSSGTAAPACCDVPLLADQISIADILVGSKADLCDGPALAAFHAWAAGLFPPKQLVATARQGQLDGSAAGTAGMAGLLCWPQQASSKGDGEPSSPAAAAQPEPGNDAMPVRRPRQGVVGQPWLSSSSSSADARNGPAAEEHEASKERPVRKQVLDGSGAHAACGWIFHRGCIFDRSRLQALLQLLVPRTLRLKGVLRVASATWVAVSAAPGAAPTAREQDAPAPSSEAASSSQPPPPAAAAAAAAPVELSEIAYRRDSRVEMIIDVAAAAACSTQAADRDASLAAGALEQQAAQLGLDDGGSLELRVAAALSQAAAGDWDSMEALLLQTMAS